MWMQQSVETSHIGNFHQRNRFGSSDANHDSMNGNGNGNGFDGPMRPSYMGASASGPRMDNDWKSKILEGGQWLGGKVIEYGAKIARGNASGHEVDRMSQLPRNDGRANWMADIRNSSGGNGQSGFGSGSTGTPYQNDFAVERPNAYTDFGRSQSMGASASTGFGASGMSSSSPFDATRHYSDDKSRSRRGSHSRKDDMRSYDKDKKKKSKKTAKGSRHHRHRQNASDSDDSEAEAPESESESHSDTSSAPASKSDASSASESDSEPRRRHAKKHGKGKHAKTSSKRREALSDDDESEDALEENKATSRKAKAPPRPQRASSDYTFSLDTSKLPPPPPAKALKDDSSTHAKSPKTGSKGKSKSKSKKSSKSSRHRKQSMEATASEASSDEANNQEQVSISRKSVKSKKKLQSTNNQDNVVNASADNVDLLGVDFDFVPMPATTASVLAAPIQSTSVQPSVFDQAFDPLQDLAGLNFLAPASQPTLESEPPANALQFNTEPTTTPPSAAHKLLPDNNLIDFDALASTSTKKNKGTASDKTLAELQRSSQQEQKQHVMTQPSAQLGAMPTNMSGMPMNPMQMQMQMQMQMNQMNVMMQQMQMQPQAQQAPSQQSQVPAASSDPFDSIFPSTAPTPMQMPMTMPPNQPIDRTFQ